MKAYNAVITKENIFNYFTQSGLTMEAFANILGVSKRWLEYVFSQKEDYEFAPSTIQKACDFFIADFGKFTTELLEVPINLREHLKKKHAKNTEYSKVLHDPPSLPFIINNELIYESEFGTAAALEVKEIKKIILRYYPKIELTNLSNSLQKSPLIECKPHPTKKNTNVYKKK